MMGSDITMSNSLPEIALRKATVTKTVEELELKLFIHADVYGWVSNKPV